MNTLLESQVYWRLIALAQAVPEVEHNFLFDWICGVLDGPLSTAQLSKLTLNDLKKSPPEGMTSFDDGRWKSVVACLHGELPSHLDPRPVSAGESEGQLKVAFASSDGLNVNGHFGKCPLFFIYQVNEKNARLVDIRRMSSQDAEENTSGSENNEVRAELLKGCHLLFCESIGGPAAARVIRHGIHPIKIKRDPKIETQLAELTGILGSQLPQWLAKALGRKDNLINRFDPEHEADD